MGMDQRPAAGPEGLAGGSDPAPCGCQPFHFLATAAPCSLSSKDTLGL